MPPKGKYAKKKSETAKGKKNLKKDEIELKPEDLANLTEIDARDYEKLMKKNTEKIIACEQEYQRAAKLLKDAKVEALNRKREEVHQGIAEELIWRNRAVEEDYEEHIRSLNKWFDMNMVRHTRKKDAVLSFSESAQQDNFVNVQERLVEKLHEGEKKEIEALIDAKIIARQLKQAVQKKDINKMAEDLTKKKKTNYAKLDFYRRVLKYPLIVYNLREDQLKEDVTFAERVIMRAELEEKLYDDNNLNKLAENNPEAEKLYSIWSSDDEEEPKYVKERSVLFVKKKKTKEQLEKVKKKKKLKKLVKLSHKKVTQAKKMLGKKIAKAAKKLTKRKKLADGETTIDGKEAERKKGLKVKLKKANKALKAEEDPNGKKKKFKKVRFDREAIERKARGKKGIKRIAGDGKAERARIKTAKRKLKKLKETQSKDGKSEEKKKKKTTYIIDADGNKVKVKKNKKKTKDKKADKKTAEEEQVEKMDTGELSASAKEKKETVKKVKKRKYERDPSEMKKKRKVVIDSDRSLGKVKKAKKAKGDKKKKDRKESVPQFSLKELIKKMKEEKVPNEVLKFFTMYEKPIRQAKKIKKIKNVKKEKEMAKVSKNTKRIKKIKTKSRAASQEPGTSSQTYDTTKEIKEELNNSFEALSVSPDLSGSSQQIASTSSEKRLPEITDFMSREVKEELLDS